MKPTFFGLLRRAKVPALAVSAALMLIVVPAALAGRGVGGVFNLGKVNTVNRTTALRGNTDSPTLRLNNKSIDGNATALSLQVGPALPPMKVNSATRVDNLNADHLDGMDAFDFVGTNTTAFLRNALYRIEDSPAAGTLLGDGTYMITRACNSGDALLSGGPANVAATSDLLESFPVSSSTWQARIDNNGVPDNWSVVALCANQ